MLTVRVLMRKYNEGGRAVKAEEGEVQLASPCSSVSLLSEMGDRTAAEGTGLDSGTALHWSGLGYRSALDLGTALHWSAPH